MSDKYKARYEVSDGYVGKDRPLYFTIHESEIEDDMDKADLQNLYYDSMQDHFEQTVGPSEASGDVEAFMAWAEQVKQSKGDE